MIRTRLRTASLMMIAAAMLLLGTGCTTNGAVYGYYGYGYYDRYPYDPWYRNNVIVARPPPGYRPPPGHRPPPGNRPKPEHPVHRPPGGRPTTLPATSMPRPAPGARPALRR